jgi:hypothetical protein
VTHHIVVAFRMSPGGLPPGPEGTYLSRARALCARGEALGARLVAWSAAVFALAWDPDSIEEAIELAISVRDEARSPSRAWACGLAEGELEPLAAHDSRAGLAWGEALLTAASLARIAKPGDVLVDGDVRAVRAGQLQLTGIRAATDAGRRVRGWQLHLELPWKVAEDIAPDIGSDRPPPEDDEEEVSSAEILQIIEEVHPFDVPPRRTEADVSVRRMLRSASVASAVDALPVLRRARTDADLQSPADRCRTSLALALALSMAGRHDEALLEALDALARAREQGTSEPFEACRALLAKLYGQTGRVEAATLIATMSP